MIAAARDPDARVRVAIVAAALPNVLVGLLNATYLGRLVDTPVLYWLADTAQWLLLPAVCLYALARFGAVAPVAYGVRGPHPHYPIQRLAADAVLASALLALAYFGTAAVIAPLLPITPPAFSYDAVMPAGAMRLPVVIYFAVTAGVVEEVIYRGLPWTALALRTAAPSRAAVAGYVTGTAALFASIHWEGGWIEVIPAFAVGVCAALLYLRIGNLWPLIVAHTVVNLIAFW